ncbi:MAG: nucleotidyltransferase domain-containing protein [Spirochaetaceae bacterium]|nr:nucleotidyltransferase domain-containing protein [Spirochaetaceae bacterium]
MLDSFLRRITPVRAEVVELYLYGSRSRGDHRPDSDYDVFVVLRERARPTVDALYDAVVDVVCETGSLISLKIVSRESFKESRAAGNSFVANVLHDGVPLALH